MAKVSFDIAGRISRIKQEARTQDTGIDAVFGKTRPARLIAALLIVIITAVLPWSGFVKNVFAVGRIKTICSIAACLAAGCDILWTGIREAAGKKLGDNGLMALAAIIAAACGHPASAAIALVIFHLSRFFMKEIVYRGNEDANCFSGLIPDSARVVVNGISAQRELDSVQVGTAILVEPGERIPLDGIIRSGNSQINSGDILGGKDPRDAVIGDRVYSGEMNVSAPITIEVTASSADSTLQRMSAIVESSLDQRSGAAKSSERVAAMLVPGITALGLIISVVIAVAAKLPFSECVSRFGLFVAAACPGSAVIALPLVYFISVGREARRGVLLKTPVALDNLCATGGFYFNKTGTLTDGEYRIVGVAANKIPREELLRLVAYVEYGVKHPIARAVRKAVGEGKAFSAMDTRSEVPGAGIYAVVGGNDVHIGSKKLMDSIDCPVKSYDSCEFYVAINRQYAGTVVLEENIRQDAYGVPAELHDAGVNEVGVMSSCSEADCKRVADAIGADAVYSGLRSDEKMARLEQLKSEKNTKIAYVGCDAEDGAAIAYADTGFIQYSSPSDLTAKSPDVILMGRDLHRIPELVAAAGRVRGICRQNSALCLALKVILMLAAALGLLGLWFVVLLDAVITTLIVMLTVSAAKKVKI